MKKEFSKFQIANLKRTAQNVYPLVRRKTKLQEEIAERQAELDSIQKQIDGYQIPIKEYTGGYTTEDLVVRTVTNTGKVDKQGNPIKVTTYTLKYPDTVVPPVEETVEEAAEVVETVEEEAGLPFGEIEDRIIEQLSNNF